MKVHFKQSISGVKSSDATRYLFICFRLLGVSMPDKYKIPYIIYSVIVNTLSTVLLPITFTLSYVTGAKDIPLNQLLQSLQTGINVTACVTKFTIIVFMKRKLVVIKAIVDEFDSRKMHPFDVFEVKKVIKLGQRLVVFLCFVNYSYSISAFVEAFFSGHPPYSFYNPFLDWRKSKLNFGIQSFIEFTMLNIACLQDVANDTFALIYVRILHTQFNILIQRVSRIGTDPDLNQEENLKELLLCIKDHKKLIELSKAIAAVISWTNFVQFLVSGLVLGIAFINISAFGDRSTIIGSVIFIGGMVLELLPICYFVNSLQDDAQRLPNAIFHLNWMDQNKPFQKNCIFFIHRAQKTMVFAAAKIVPISLSSFVAIIKFSFSMCTLLSTMDLASRFNQPSSTE